MEKKKLALVKQVIQKLTESQLMKVRGGNKPPTMQNGPQPGPGTTTS